MITNQTMRAVYVRFDDHDPVGPILSRRDQRRIIVLMCGLGLILFCIKLSSNPKFWSSLFPGQFVAESTEQTEKPFTIGGIEGIGDAATRPLSPDEFLAAGDNQNRLAQAAPSDFDRRNAIDESFREAEVRLDTTPRNRVSDFFPPQVLNSILDNRMGVRKSESNAYYLMLAAAARNKIAEKDIEKDATFSVLMTNSDFYRGAPIQITGKLKRLAPFQPDANQFRIMNLYDAWIFTRDSGNRPYHVVCSDVNNLKLGEDIDDPPEVTVTGYFFKREGYSTKTGTLNSAPLILAGDMYAQPVVAQIVADEDGQISRYLWWFAVAVGGALAFTIWSFAVSDYNYRFSRASQSLAPPANPDLVGIEAVDINDVLQGLAESQAYEEQQTIRIR